MNAQPATVVMVHGTFAQHEDDEGDKWWQRGSSFWTSLGRMLPADIALPESEASLFHWSGENKWSARFLGGVSLLEYLRTMDERDVPYHLVAHSHGGSVVWEALRLSTEDPQGPLKGLRTWTTVGTPFLTAQPSWWYQVRWLLLAIAAVVLITFLPTLWVNQEGPVFLITPFHIIPLALVWPAIIENRSARQEARASREAAAEYGDRWRGLFSRHDEAITGLMASSAVRVTLPQKRPLDAELYALRPHLKRLRLVHKANAIAYRLVRSRLQAIVTSQLRAVAQGNDRPGLRRWGVSSNPLGTTRPDPLPEEVESHLLNVADSASASAIRALRRHLQTDGCAVTPTSLGLTEPGLVHTSYFSCSSFVDLLLKGMCRTPVRET